MSEEKMGWPALPYNDWAETCSALHLWSQIVGKYRLAHTPWINHSWHATLYVTPRGLTTRMVPDGKLGITLTFDFHDHADRRKRPTCVRAFRWRRSAFFERLLNPRVRSMAALYPLAKARRIIRIFKSLRNDLRSFSFSTR
jgi:hypothetical protein